eukprot:gnl/Dysnectes_brevis/5284_a7533_620.p1 GENE.gnl/Dysnectes_brevis/5284_a7533_620~~gnl/Dysnectes_brevis/5284_a7533_620.p1  ORF type:complete len:208 (-),score=52.05 gnl/Dysnectes_brevis/5284_a7533_620:60-683(-)
MAEVTVTNIVATLTLPERVRHGLKSLSNNFVNVVYQPKRFSALIVPVKVPEKSYHVTVLLFNKGKIVVTGAKSQKDSMDACKSFLLQYSSIYDEPLDWEECDYTVQNIFAMGDLGYLLPDLYTVAEALGDAARYSPEDTTGLTYTIARDPSLRTANPTTVIVYTRKLILMGARTTKQAEEAWRLAKQRLAEFRQTHQPATHYAHQGM